MTECIGKVYLVGAGPGNVAYLTLRAEQLLKRADVLVYDALIDAQLLQLVPLDCLKLDVGKRGGQPSTPQVEIDQLLVEHCRQGKQVVRLKSGDPFIFGRSSSEIQALVAAECPFDVVPGISSALAAPLLAGIPLTDPVLSRCFAVMSAHEPDELDWEALVQLETLVILMGGRQLGEIVHQLQRHGRSPAARIAVIRWTGTPQQQVWTGTLATIVDQTKGISLSPAVIVVGEVVGLREYLRSDKLNVEGSLELNVERLNVEGSLELNVERLNVEGSQDNLQLANGQPATPEQPATLTGKTVLVTRSAEQSSQFSALLQQEGATVIEMPALAIAPPSSWEALDRACDRLSNFDWLILTSGNGVDYFFERLLSRGKDARALAGVKIAVVGKKTAASLKGRSLKPDFIPPDFVADSLIAYFPEPFANQNVLFPRVETGGREVLVKELTAQGARVEEVPAYQSRRPDRISPPALDALQQQTVDIVTFASSKTVKNFYQLVEDALTGTTGPTLHALLEGVCIASIGPQTSETCRQLLGRVDVEAQEYTLDGLVAAIRRWAT